MDSRFAGLTFDQIFDKLEHGTIVKCQGCPLLSHSSTSKDWLCVLQWGECPRMAFDRRLEKNKLRHKQSYKQKDLWSEK